MKPIGGFQFVVFLLQTSLTFFCCCMHSILLLCRRSLPAGTSRLLLPSSIHCHHNRSSTDYTRSIILLFTPIPILIPKFIHGRLFVWNYMQIHVHEYVQTHNENSMTRHLAAQCLCIWRRRRFNGASTERFLAWKVTIVWIPPPPILFQDL